MSMQRRTALGRGGSAGALRKRCGWLLAAAVVCGWPTTSRADGDIEADLYPEFIKRTIGNVLSGELEKQGAELTGIALARVDDTTLHITVEITLLGFKLPMALEANLSETCDLAGPDLKIEEVVLNPLLPIDDEQVAKFTKSAQATLSAKVDEIIGPLWTQLGRLRSEGIARKVCPHVVVQPDGTIHAELHFSDGCINGVPIHIDCAPSHWGSGIDYDCENGLRVLTERDCTPNGRERP